MKIRANFKRMFFVSFCFFITQCLHSPTVLKKDAETNPLYSTSHVDFKKWGRSEDSCCSAKGTQIAISSGGPLSSQAGMSISKQGGNVVDVAIATALCLNVERSQSTSLGGGGFMLLSLRGPTYIQTFVDFREVAPLGSTPSQYLDEKGEPIPQRSLEGGKAVAVPGMVAGLYDVHKKYGKLPWEKVVAPAVELARQGFVLYPSIAEKIETRKDVLRRHPYTTSLLFKNNGQTPLQIGDRWVQTDLAKSLELIARYGKKPFYQGEIAKKIVASVQKLGGVLSLSDLKNYQVKWRVPLSGTYKGISYLTAPPPSAGGFILSHIFEQLKRFDLPQEVTSNPTLYLALVAEAMKRAYADRSEVIGDPDNLSSAQKEAWIKAGSTHYRDLISQVLQKGVVTPSAQVKPLSTKPKENHGTTHVSVLDEKGNAISMTLTLNTGNFGAGFAAEGTGIFMNNEIDDFSFIAGKPNAYGLVSNDINLLKAGKRPVSSMTPNIFFLKEKPRLVIGGAGGSKIISAVLSTALNYLFVFPNDLKKSVLAPRIHHQWMPDRLEVEKGLPLRTREQLSQLGYTVIDAMWMADIEAVAAGPDGDLEAVFDPRNQGGVNAY